VGFPSELNASCEYAGREGSGRIATTVLPAIVTCVFLSRAGKAVFANAVCLLTGITGIGL
jgi:hypothetical protein